MLYIITNYTGLSQHNTIKWFFFSDAVDSTVLEMRLGQEKLQELGVCTHSKGDSLTMEEDGDNSNFHLFGAQKTR